jgi:hypothetical protein
MKVKLFFIYEEKDKAIQETFTELMNFPDCQEEYFPKHYFEVLMGFLTKEQKEWLLRKHKQENTLKTTLQIELIENQVNEENKNPGCNSLEVDDLKKVELLPSEQRCQTTTSASLQRNRSSMALLPS